MGDPTEEYQNIDFYHPFTPYDVQLQFMRTVYDVLERGDGQIGILESPTGTVSLRSFLIGRLYMTLTTDGQGKSLSLICAAVTWLRNHKKARYETSVSDAAAEFRDEPDWVVDQMLKRKREELLKGWEEREARLARLRAKEKMLEQRGAKRRRVDDGPQRSRPQSTEDDDEWLLADRETDGVGGEDSSTPSFSRETRTLMEKLGMGSLKKEDDGDKPEEDEIKVTTPCFIGF